MKNSYIGEIEILYKPKRTGKELFKISNSDDAYKYFKKVWSKRMSHVEEVYLLCLNCANQVLGYSQISLGGINGCLIDPKVVFQVALKANASGVIMAHNHPSGSLNPSVGDLRITKKLAEGAKVLDVSFLDHIILSSKDYLSLSEKGYMES